MELRVMTEPQFGASYAAQAAYARQAEACGFGGFFRSDHYLSMGGDGLPGPTDSWVTLAAIARETSRIRLGTLVSSGTFRLPGVLAISVAQVDEMSGGRVELGIGAGWFEAEHSAYGIPFPPTGERFARLTEQLEILTGLFGTPVGELFSFAGEHYTVTDSPALPKPVQSPLPVIVGGTGLKRTPALAARFAAEFNVAFLSVAEARLRWDAADEACETAGRADRPAYSVMLHTAIGRTDAEVARRSQPYGDGATGLIGSPEQAVDVIGQYAEAGCSRVYLQSLDLADLDQLELIGAEVIPQV